MSQLVRYLKDDHSLMRDLIEDLTSVTKAHTEKKVIMDRLAALILTHQKGEEIILYIPGKGTLELGVRDLVLKGFQQHSLIDDLIDKIRVTQNHDLWTAKVKVLADLLLLHFREQEKEFFPKLKNYLTEDQMDEAAEKYLRIKQGEQMKYDKENRYRLGREIGIGGMII